MLRSALVLSALMLATPAAAVPWKHPTAGFSVDLPKGWEEDPASRRPNTAFVTRGPVSNTQIGCTIASTPLGGPPASPATWAMPEAVLADPAKYMGGSGDRIATLLGKRKFAGADGYPGWQLWADVLKPGADQPSFKLIAHVLSAPSTQLTVVCFTPARVRPSLPPAAIDEALAMSRTLRAAR